MSDSRYTVALIKAATVGRGHAPDIMSEITKAGFHIVACKHRSLCPTTIRAFYAEHVDRPYYQNLEASVGLGRPVVALVLKHPRGDAVQRWRSMMGATNSAEAAPGTIRSRWGGHVFMGNAAPRADNAVHGSDSLKAAEREYAILFTNPYPNTLEAFGE